MELSNNCKIMNSVNTKATLKELPNSWILRAPKGRMKGGVTRPEDQNDAKK